MKKWRICEDLCQKTVRANQFYLRNEMAFTIEDKFILEAETVLGIKFPEEYKSRMRQQNGGSLLWEEEYWQLYPFFDQSDFKKISRTCNHIVKETGLAREWAHFPSDAVAIASNGSGDYFLFLPKIQTELGSELYLWLHETGEVSKIADSIEDFDKEP